MKRQVYIMLSVALASFLAGTLFNVNFMAAGDGDGKPLDKVWQAIYQLQSRVDSLNASLIELQSKVDAMNASLTSQINDLESQIAVLQNDIATLRTQVSSLDASVDGLQLKVNDLNASLIELENRVTALETWIPKKGYVSISAAAFQTFEHSQQYYLFGSYLTGSGNFYANVQLPHGTTVTNMAVYLYDTQTDAEIIVWLKRGDTPMANVKSGGAWGGGWVVLYNDTINYPEIDNQNYSYYLQLVFTQWVFDSLRLYRVVITYEYPA